MIEIASMSSRPSAADDSSAFAAEQATPVPRWTRFATVWALAAAVAGFATSLPVLAKSHGMKQGSAMGDRGYCQQRAREDDTDMTACMKEMAAARAIRPSELTTPDMPTGQANAETRCAVLPMNQRDACLMRERDINTTTSGSVKAGGVLRTTRQVVPASRQQGASAPR